MDKERTEGPIEGQATEQNPTEGPQNEKEETVNGEASATTALEQELQKSREDYLRLYADFENFRRRNSKERLELIATSSADLLSAILPILDDMERAIKVNEDSSDTDAIKEGFKLVYQKLIGIAQGKGLRAMDPMHEAFNEDIHEAVTNVPVEDKKLKGKVIDVVEKGYTLHDKILRHPKVIIGS